MSKSNMNRIKKSQVLKMSIAFVGLFLFSQCALVGAVMMARHATCDVKINKNGVNGSCELINGVFFEKLTVSKYDTTGLPLEYSVTERFACYNPGMGGVQTYWPKKIDFKKTNGHYLWSADTVSVQYKVVGQSRELVLATSKPRNYNEHFIFSSTKYETCPIRFQKDTWYYVKIPDQRLRNVYLHIDKKGNYKVYKTNSGVSPI
jgi:hypothetical protein